MGRFDLVRVLVGEVTAGAATWFTPVSQSDGWTYLAPAITGGLLLVTLACRCSQRFVHGYPATFEV